MKLLRYLHFLMTSSQFQMVCRGFRKSVALFLIIEPVWVAMAALFVLFSYLHHMGAAFPWIGLLLACLPFPLRRIYQGCWGLRTPFDIPIVLFIAGALIGLIISPDKSISLGAFQSILAFTLFYYSWVNYPHLGTLTKWFIPLGFLAVLAVIPFVINGTGTHHGIALSLLIVAAILIGMAIFSKDTIIKIVFGCIIIFLGITILFMTRDSWPSLFITGISISGRLLFWRRTIHLLGQHPFSGLGLGCWALVYHNSKIISHPTNAHNAYLELYANNGILGILALIVSLFVFSKLALDIIRSPRNHPWYGFGIGILLACLGVLIVGIIESSPIGTPCVHPDTYYYIISPVPWILAGFLVTAHRLLPRKDSKKD